MKASITPSKVREQYSDYRPALCKEAQDILDSGFHAMDSRFQVVDSGFASRVHAGGGACEKAFHFERRAKRVTRKHASGRQKRAGLTPRFRIFFPLPLAQDISRYSPNEEFPHRLWLLAIDTYSRTPVTRTLQGNEKQFELAGNSSYRDKFQ